ncbi:MAG: hypothetical protein R3C18_13210 [Planctomycetaceae bacterium]
MRNVEPHRRKDGMTVAELAMKVFDAHHLDREVSPQREVSDD